MDSRRWPFVSCVCRVLRPKSYCQRHRRQQALSVNKSTRIYSNCQVTCDYSQNNMILLWLESVTTRLTSGTSCYIISDACQSTINTGRVLCSSLAQQFMQHDIVNVQRNTCTKMTSSVSVQATKEGQQPSSLYRFILIVKGQRSKLVTCFLHCCLSWAAWIHVAIKHPVQSLRPSVQRRIVTFDFLHHTNTLTYSLTHVFLVSTVF